MFLDLLLRQHVYSFIFLGNSNAELETSAIISPLCFLISIQNTSFKNFNSFPKLHLFLVYEFPSLKFVILANFTKLLRKLVAIIVCACVLLIVCLPSCYMIESVNLKNINIYDQQLFSFQINFYFSYNKYSIIQNHFFSSS